MKHPVKIVPFDIFLPATICDDQGNPLDAQFVETIKIEVYGSGDFEFITPESSEEIEACKIKALYKRGTKNDLDSIKKIIEYKLERI